MSGVDLDKAQRETARWRILAILDAGRPLGVSEITMGRALSDAALRVTPHELREELDYLEKKDLVTTDRESGTWSAALTGLGIDVVEYTVKCPAGIARPEKYW